MEKTLYLGIDPGKTGGYAVVDINGEIVTTDPFTSWRDIYTDLRQYRPDIKLCAIEKVAAVPGDKRRMRSLATFMQNYGGWLALLEVLRIPHELTPAGRWQKMWLGTYPRGESKARSVDFINRRYPDVKLKKSDHGISDALCLSLYAVVSSQRVSKRLRNKASSPAVNLRHAHIFRND